jgi:serine/threonine protein kinase
MTDSTQKFSLEAPKSGKTGTLQINSILQNRYKITGVLGMGGMGSVYLARDLRFPNVVRNVAVKEMINVQADPVARETALRNFGRESDVLAALTHPAIPKIYDYFASKDRAYLVMEYVDGKDLETYLNQMTEFIPSDMVRKWAIELCDVLNYLHTHQPDPIIFRDVKPSNIMIDKQGRVHLIDFGIARPFQNVPGQKVTMIGTEGYSPPEQYKGDATPQSDIFAVGATLHHLLTRRDPRIELPFSFAERPIRLINPKVSPEFEAIIVMALNYDLPLRFKTIGDMKTALEALDHPVARTVDNGSALKPASATEEVAEFPDDSKRGMVWKFKVEDEIRSSPVFYKGVIYVGAYDNNLYGVTATDGKLRFKYATRDGIPGTPAIADSESLLLFGSEDQSLYAIDLRTNKIAWSHQTDGPVRGSVAVAHGHAFVGSDDRYLYAVRLSNGRRDWRYDAGSAVRSRPVITEDRVVFGTESGEVLGLDLQSGLKWHFKTKRAVTSSPVIVDKVVYFGSMDGHVYAIETVNGWSVWRFRTNKPIVSSPIIVDKALYIGSADGNLYAIDLNGHELWRFKTNGQIVSTPAYSNGALYFGSTDNKVYSVDARKGQLRWEYETGGPVTSSACVVDNLVYIGSTDHHLYAFTT